MDRDVLEYHALRMCEVLYIYFDRDPNAVLTKDEFLGIQWAVWTKVKKEIDEKIRIRDAKEKRIK